MKKIPVWKNIVLIISVLVIIIIATFAWFYTGPRADIGSLDLNVGEASFIQISSDHGNNWSGNLDIDIGMNKNFKELSGNGIDLFAPVYDVVEKEDGSFGAEILSFEKANGTDKYYEQVFMFRADVDHDVYLNPSSFVTSVSGQDDGCIDGAIRVAFIELDQNGRETLKYIWAPNATVEFSEEDQAFTRDGNVETNYFYQKTVTPVDVSTLTGDLANRHVAMISTADTDESNCGYDAAHKFMWSSEGCLPLNAPPLLTVRGSAMDENTEYQSLKVKVWLEGHDRECVSQLSGEKFTMKLQFDAESRGE